MEIDCPRIGHSPNIVPWGKNRDDPLMFRLVGCFLMILLPLGASAQGAGVQREAISPPAREANLPRTRWENVPGNKLWTRAAIASLKAHASPLTQIVPRDIAEWCPAYPQANETARRAFWVGLLSTLAKHESTYRPYAVGGGGKWYGLLQILPGTARGYGCRARTGTALKHGPDNLSCALRIMTTTVSRDGVVSKGMRGVAADWGPFHSSKKHKDMKRWMIKQSYCKPLSSVRPRTRPVAFETANAD